MQDILTYMNRSVQLGVIACTLLISCGCISDRISDKESVLSLPENYVIPRTGTPMAPIKAGHFMIPIRVPQYLNDGVTRSDWNQIDVTLSSDYWMGQYEVTQREYRMIMGRNPSKHKSDNCPVTNVSWKDALIFCQRLNEMDKRGNRVPDGYIYRLPTQAEWEDACRAGTTTRFFFGDNPDNLATFAWTSENSSGTLQSVGLKRPNPWGLYDMFGNVLEICLDSYFIKLKEQVVIDPLSTPTEGECIGLSGGIGRNLNNEPCAGYVAPMGMNRTNNSEAGFRIVLAKIPKDWDKIEALLPVDTSPKP